MRCDDAPDPADERLCGAGGLVGFEEWLSAKLLKGVLVFCIGADGHLPNQENAAIGGLQSNRETL